MKKAIKNLSAILIGTIFALSPVILLVTYCTETEKTVAPILLLIIVICALPIIIDEIKIKTK